MKRSAISAFAGFALMALAGYSAWSQPLKELTLVQMHPVIGVGEEVFLYAVPKRLGYFRSEGLDMRIQGAPSGTVAAQVIQTNGAQFGTTSPESVMQMREQGGDIVAFYGLKRNAGTFVVVMDDSSITKIEDLKGRTIGANSFGSGGGFSLKQGLSELGIAPTQYIQVTIPPGPGAFTALQTRKLDALVVWDAMLGVAENSGLKLRKISISFVDRLAGMTMAVNGPFARANPAMVAGYCRAMTKALLFTKSNPEAAISLFWEEFPTVKPTNLDNATARRNAAHVLGRFLEAALEGQPENADMGEFIPDAWQKTFATFKRLGSLKGTGTAADAYTAQFVPACNDFDRTEIVRQAASYAK
jgi:NitT/TauT family transport system substrate-binding protein